MLHSVRWCAAHGSTMALAIKLCLNRKQRMISLCIVLKHPMHQRYSDLRHFHLLSSHWKSTNFCFCFTIGKLRFVMFAWLCIDNTALCSVWAHNKVFKNLFCLKNTNRFSSKSSCLNSLSYLTYFPSFRSYWGVLARLTGVPAIIGSFFVVVTPVHSLQKILDGTTDVTFTFWAQNETFTCFLNSFMPFRLCDFQSHYALKPLLRFRFLERQHLTSSANTIITINKATITTII